MQLKNSTAELFEKRKVLFMIIATFLLGFSFGLTVFVSNIPRPVSMVWFVDALALFIFVFTSRRERH